MNETTYALAPLRQTTGQSSPRGAQAAGRNRTPQEGEVLFGVKTAFSAMVTEALPASLTIREAIDELIRIGPATPQEADVLNAVAQEHGAARRDYFALNAAGELDPKDAETRIGSIAVRTETRTPQGLEIVKAARVVVQSYADVGDDRG
jgi:hypothetical protein